MEVLTANSTTSANNPREQDNTTTFLIGFGVLLVFVVIGVLASAFLCMTLKKDQYLWEAETQLQEKRCSIEVADKERERLGSMEEKNHLSLSN
ncbi:hypothetical protein Trydic_g3167 [Trypoxylus dichotomus]